jgi:hypothetical protein
LIVFQKRDGKVVRSGKTAKKRGADFSAERDFSEHAKKVKKQAKLSRARRAEQEAD